MASPFFALLFLVLGHKAVDAVPPQRLLALVLLGFSVLCGLAAVIGLRHPQRPLRNARLGIAGFVALFSGALLWLASQQYGYVCRRGFLWSNCDPGPNHLFGVAFWLTFGLALVGTLLIRGASPQPKDWWVGQLSAAIGIGISVAAGMVAMLNLVTFEEQVRKSVEATRHTPFLEGMVLLAVLLTLAWRRHADGVD